MVRGRYKGAETAQSAVAAYEFLGLPGKECKKAVKAASMGLYGRDYIYGGVSYPSSDFHISLFYDLLYPTALTEPENARAAALLRESGYDTFSDLASVSLNSQARGCAIYTGLYKSGQLDRLESAEEILRLFRFDMSRPDCAAEDAYDNVQLLTENGCYRPLRPTVPQTVTADEVRKEYFKLTE